MLRRASLAVVVGVVAAVTAAVGPAAAGPLGPDDPCVVDPTAVGCEDHEGADSPGGGTGSGGGGANSCGPHNGVEVPCVDEDLGFWVGTPNIIYGFYTGGPEGPELAGCWARRDGFLGPRPQPEQSFPIRGEDPGGPGRWYTLSCLGADGVWPDDVAAGVAQAWLLTGQLPQTGPDPQTLARRALAQIGLSAPEIRVFPPTTGSSPVGMPTWLTTTQTPQTWGPISDTFCDRGLCVSISARAVRIDWDMADGAVVRCVRGQNVAWQPNMDFLVPQQAGACHHVYTTPSRDQPDGRYRVSATTTFHARWSGGGESGVFTGVADACGPGGDAACTSTAQVQVEEIQVLVDR